MYKDTSCFKRIGYLAYVLTADVKESRNKNWDFI